MTERPELTRRTFLLGAGAAALAAGFCPLAGAGALPDRSAYRRPWTLVRWCQFSGCTRTRASLAPKVAWLRGVLGAPVPSAVTLLGEAGAVPADAPFVLTLDYASGASVVFTHAGPPGLCLRAGFDTALVPPPERSPAALDDRQVVATVDRLMAAMAGPGSG
jgi:hypothetical protein